MYLLLNVGIFLHYIEVFIISSFAIWDVFYGDRCAVFFLLIIVSWIVITQVSELRLAFCQNQFEINPKQ